MFAHVYCGSIPNDFTRILQGYFTGNGTTQKDRINSLWPGNIIWRHRSEVTLVQVMACCLTAPSWTNVDFSSLRSNYIHLTAISQEMHSPSITKIHLKITYLYFLQISEGLSLRFVICGVHSGFVQNDLNHILQGYFTCTGTIIPWHRGNMDEKG